MTGDSPAPGSQRTAIDTTVIVPELVRSARADRRFLLRAVQYLAGEEGIRQSLDIGTGLPTAADTHHVAQRVAAESRIVYADNDPVVPGRWTWTGPSPS